MCGGEGAWEGRGRIEMAWETDILSGSPEIIGIRLNHSIWRMCPKWQHRCHNLKVILILFFSTALTVNLDLRIQELETQSCQSLRKSNELMAHQSNCIAKCLRFHQYTTIAVCDSSQQ